MGVDVTQPGAQKWQEVAVFGKEFLMLPVLWEVKEDPLMRETCFWETL